MVAENDGYIKFHGFKTYYKTFGKAKGKAIPLLVLHGGPGSTHNYLLGLSDLAKSGRQVIFYDQLGCGKSDMPKDDSLWTVNLFIDELNIIRDELGLDQVHILGHSWGGMLAIDYLLTRPAAIKSVILASAMISIPLYQTEVEKLKAALPQGIGQIMNRHENDGTTNSQEYREAYAVYNRFHLFRGAVFPAKYSAANVTIGDDPYQKLWGVSEACANGELKNWDRITKLKEIKVPTLITSGQYDELTPMQAAITANQISGSELAIITNGAHLTHIEQEQEYLDIVSKFLAKHD